MLGIGKFMKFGRVFLSFIIIVILIIITTIIKVSLIKTGGK